MNNISKAAVIAAVAIMVAVFAVPMMSGDTDAATDAWDGKTDTSWYDEASEETSYEITTAEQLAGLAKLVNEGKTFDGVTITLGTDLDLSGHAWIPIGFSGRVNPEESLDNIMRFEGTFDGDEHTITGLTSSGYVVESGDSRIVENAYTYGLFGFVIDATVSNITLADVNIDLGSAGDISCDTAGAAVGYALGTTSLSNIKVSGSVTATDATGGVIGRFYGNQITITGCQSTADVKSTEADGGKAGGIIGILGLKNSSSISGCTISGEISATHAGGMIGLANSTSGTHTFSDISVSDSTITGNLYSGGVVGRGSIGVSLSDCTVINSKISAVGDSLVEYNPKISYNAGGLMGGQGGRRYLDSHRGQHGDVMRCRIHTVRRRLHRFNPRITRHYFRRLCCEHRCQRREQIGMGQPHHSRRSRWFHLLWQGGDTDSPHRECLPRKRHHFGIQQQRLLRQQHFLRSHGRCCNLVPGRSRNFRNQGLV